MSEQNEALKRAGGNAVAYSEKAWAAPRKASQGGADGHWFPDQGAHASRSLTANEMAEWVDDWEILRDPASL